MRRTLALLLLASAALAQGMPPATRADSWTSQHNQKRLRLVVLVENDPALVNIYHVMTMNAAKFPRVNAAGGQAFADYLLSPETQQLLGDFGKDKFGRALFAPAAGKSEEELHK